MERCAGWLGQLDTTERVSHTDTPGTRASERGELYQLGLGTRACVGLVLIALLWESPSGSSPYERARGWET